MFKIGQRVKYRKENEYTGLRECSGVVTNVYPGGQRCTDSETKRHYIQPTHYAVRDDSLPEWWGDPCTE